MTAVELRPPAEAHGVAGHAESTRAFWAVVVVAAAVKLLILALNGPSGSADSFGYIDFADAILDHGRAFAPVVWGAEAMPPFIFRPPGYPLLLAAAKLISPDDYASVIVAVQIAVNLATTYLMFRVAARLLRSAGAALAAVVLYVGSTSLLWDNSVLSDSLFASFWNVVVVALLGHLVGCWQLKLRHFCGLGVVWGYSLWLRDVGIYLTVLPAVLLVMVVLRERAHRTVAAAGLGLFLLLAGGFAGATVLLNLHRTGEAFFSISGVANWLQPIFALAAQGHAQPFADDDLISTAVRETAKGYGYEDQLRLIPELHRRCGCTPTQLQALMFAKYRAVVERFPVAYARVLISNFNYFALGELVANPLATLNQLLEFGAARPDWRLPGLSLRNLAALREHFSGAMLLLMLASALAEAVSAVVFTAYMLGTPIVLCRAAWRRAFTIDEAAIGFLWFSFVSVSLLFSLVHYEARYALPLLPGAALGVVWIARRLPQEFRRRAVPVVSADG
jgi:hypothetical protein